MDSAILANARTIQLIGLAIIVIVALILGARVAGMGAKGFASLLMEFAGLLVAVWIIARPNDVTGILTRSVGGVQSPAAISVTAPPTAP